MVKSKQNSSDWTEILEYVFNPTPFSALDGTPVQRVAYEYRRKLLTRPDGPRLALVLSGLQIGLELERDAASTAAKEQTEEATKEWTKRGEYLRCRVRALLPIVEADLRATSGKKEPSRKAVCGEIAARLGKEGISRTDRTIRGYVRELIRTR
jgi:hypothetical protein